MEKKIYDSVSSFSLKCGSRNWSCGEEPNIKTLQESGRSILEIIAVLTVMSVITFGGFKGYEMVSKKIKMNAISSDLAALVKERQIRVLDKTEKGAEIRNEKIGSIPVHVQNGTPEDGDKEPFFWVDVDFDKKEECEEFLYTDLLEPAFIAIDNSIPGECPGEIRLYYPKDPKDNITGIKTYVNPSDGKTYICYGDDCNQSNGGTYGLACRTGYMPNKDKTKCEKITCSTYRGTGFANEYYAGGFVGFANDGVTRCYCPTGQTFEVDQCITSTSECSGHGSNSSGLCSCLAGYCGNNCENRVTCFNAGIWTEHGCNCAEGWAGTYCDEPASNNCSNHGVYQGNRCICNEGYYGAACEYYNDCSGNGRVNTDGTCTCDDGYYGTDCENRENTDSCNGHGIDCGSGCVCNEGYYGTYCESYNDCSGNGQVDSNGTCTCNSDYYGANCEYYNDCSGNGRVNPDGTCTCNSSYYGMECEYYNDCSGNGRVNPDGICTCNDGYYGTDCEDEYCSGHGTLCGGYCSCDDGWYGTYCESEGASDPCNGHGTLDWPGWNYFSGWPDACLCEKRYTGNLYVKTDQCSHVCNESLYCCSNHGQWIGCGCLCDSGYCGRYCENITSSACNGLGRAGSWWAGNHFLSFCLCNDGTIQEGYNACASTSTDPCNGHGTLDWAGAHYSNLLGATWGAADGGFCLCDKGYYGVEGDGTIGSKQCSLTKQEYTGDANRFCNDHGQWAGFGCVCDTGYYALGEVYCNAVSTSNEICNGNGRALISEFDYHNNRRGCLCNDGTIQEGDPLNGNLCASTQECSGHGTLDWPGANYWSGYSDVCLCDKGYYGADCSQSKSACYNHGQYSVVGCICDSGYQGSECYSMGDRCNGNGQYIAFGFNDNNGSCLCNDGTIQEGYNACASTSTDLCAGHGTLDWAGANYWPLYPNLCLCEKGYAGMIAGNSYQCTVVCDSNRCCSNHGQWMGCGCVCDIGYCGQYCENTTSSACNGQGRVGSFLLYSQSFCLCNDGTIQEGYNACASTSTECSGHGTLNWLGANYWSGYSDVCLCDKGYYGADCSQSKSACYNHGQYSVVGCVCDSGYQGSECYSSGDLCNGNGQYIAFGFNYNNGSCLCNDGTIQTGAVACAPCSGHGIMVNGSCVCGSGWYGANCDSNCDGVWWGGVNHCYPCSSVCGFGASLQECAACDNTSYPREVINGFCTLTKAGCDAFYPASGGFRSDNYSWCSSCSDANATSNTSADACAECDGTNYPREIITNNGKNYCALTSAGCNTLYPEGWFRAYVTRTGYTGYSDQTGSCFSCSHSSGVPSTAAECNRCSNTLYPREMINEMCVPMTSSCNALYPTTGGFVEEVNGSRYCHSCSKSSVVATTADACAACDNTPYPRKMVTHKGTDYCALTSAACNALYPTTGGFGMDCYPCSHPHAEVVDANACAACDNTPYPREMVPHYLYGEICAPSSATCHAMGEFRDIDGGCRSCNYSYYLGASAEESDFCMGTAYPRFMSDELSYPCSYSEDVSTTATECAKCDNSTTPRTMKDGKCVLLAHDCSGHGTKTPAGQCVCNSGWYGNLCESDCEGWKDVDGHCHSCNEKYAFKSSECGRCPDTSLYPREMDDGKCVLTYIGCNALYPTTGGFKSASGDCYSCSEPTDISTSTFECDFCPNRKMYDNFCKLTLTCSGHGKMTASGCACDKGYDGISCENVNPNACFGHGTVTNGACVCFEGYYGTYCEGPTGCSEHGTLTNGSCVCDTGWYGAQCDSNCNGWRSLTDGCRPCDDSCGFKATLLECQKCDHTNYPREMLGEWCVLKRATPCDGWRNNNGDCWSCSNNTWFLATQSECDKCLNTATPREMIRYNGEDRCVLTDAGCNALYPTTGGFRSNGECWSCSYDYSIKTTKAECDKCATSSTPRMMDGDKCKLAPDCFGHGTKTNGTCVCNAGYSGTNCETECSGNGTITNGVCVCNSGWYGAQCDSDCDGFKGNDGTCYDCSYLPNMPGILASPSECDKCKNSNSPRFMGDDGYCYACSRANGVFTNQSECDKCINANTPREMVNYGGRDICAFTTASCHSLHPEVGGFKNPWGDCLPCDTTASHNISQDECAKCGTLRYYSYGYCWKR